MVSSPKSALVTSLPSSVTVVTSMSGKSTFQAAISASRIAAGSRPST